VEPRRLRPTGAAEICSVTKSTRSASTKTEEVGEDTRVDAEASRPNGHFRTEVDSERYRVI